MSSTIDQLPAAPQRSDDPDLFASKSDAFVAALTQFVTQANTLAANVNLAAAAPGMSATSTTSLTVGTGAQSLTVETGKQFVPGMSVVIAFSADTTNRMVGTVQSYNDSTGALDVDITLVEGSGTHADWVISLTIAIDVSLFALATEKEYIASGTGEAFDRSKGSVWVYTMTGNAVFPDSLSNGQSLTLNLKGTGWSFAPPPGSVWVNIADAALTGNDLIVVTKMNDLLILNYCGALP
ncbi:hypothetical protein [Neptuniibacter sp.]|uniref:hypothetical protein n=1 Tax=Neptuniibacter sp. TaxID=1962643 RepID=UPI00261E3BB6|nr:hypothetical protein [Neptuniibacter sp.]MCP4595771.1 hypothetical protein [Neptuniibacter sp.]